VNGRGMPAEGCELLRNRSVRQYEQQMRREMSCFAYVFRIELPHKVCQPLIPILLDFGTRVIKALIDLYSAVAT